MNGQHAVLIDVGVAVVGLDGEVGLAGAVAVYLDHVGFGNAVPVELIALYAVCFIIFVGNSGVNLNGVGGKRLGDAHIGGQNFKIDLDCGSGSFGMLLGVGRDYCDGIAELEDLFIAEDGSVPAVALVVERQHYKTVYTVLAGHILCCDDLEDAGHLLGLGSVNALDIRM